MALSFFLQLLICSGAFAWPRISEMLAPTQHHETEIELNTILLNKDSLDAYSRKPDCFRKAAGLLTTHCSQLDMNEEHRVKAAISMTLCELATAKHHTPPLECAPFAVDSNSDYSKLQGDCVNALSRSAQFWSSYSGYLREVPQLCFAFRRWNDIDTAKEIYKNATLEKLTLVQLLVAREKAAAVNVQASEQNLSEMYDLMAHIHATSVVVETVMTNWESKFSQALELFREGIVDFQRNDERHNLQSIARTEDALQQLSTRHATSLASVISTFEGSIVARLDSALNSIHNEFERSLDLSTHVQERWTHLEHEFVSMHQSITHLASLASTASRTLSTSTSHAQELQQHHFNATQSASQLIHTLGQVTVMAHDEIRKINHTAVLVKRGLIQGADSQMWNLRPMVMYIAEVVLRVNPSYLDYLSHLPISRVLFSLIGVLCSVSRMAFSSLMSVIVILISSRKYFRISLNSLSASPSVRGSSSSSSPTPPRFDPYQDQEPPHRDRYVYVYPPSRSRSRIHIAGPRLNHHHDNIQSSRIPGRLYNVSVDSI